MIMALSKCTKIGLIILMILIVLNILLTKRLIISNGRLDSDSITVDTSYSETNVRDSINKKIDTIFVTLDNNIKNEERLQKVISDSDSIAIIKRFIELCSKPVK